MLTDINPPQNQHTIRIMNACKWDLLEPRDEAYPVGEAATSILEAIATAAILTNTTTQFTRGFFLTALMGKWDSTMILSGMSWLVSAGILETRNSTRNTYYKLTENALDDIAKFAAPIKMVRLLEGMRLIQERRERLAANSFLPKELTLYHNLLFYIAAAYRTRARVDVTHAKWIDRNAYGLAIAYRLWIKVWQAAVWRKPVDPFTLDPVGYRGAWIVPEPVGYRVTFPALETQNTLWTAFFEQATALIDAFWDGWDALDETGQAAVKALQDKAVSGDTILVTIAKGAGFHQFGHSRTPRFAAYPQQQHFGCITAHELTRALGNWSLFGYLLGTFAYGYRADPEFKRYERWAFIYHGE